LGLQKGIQIEGPKRSLEIIVAVKRKAQFDLLLRRPEKAGGIQKPKAGRITVNHSFPFHVRSLFPII
jgi:hypothetical protein